MNRYVITSIIALLIFSNIFSQNTVISGKVISENSNSGIPYAIITNHKKTFGVYADSAGYFNLSLAPQEDLLIISALGYETKQYKIKETGNISIKLKENIYDLDEVVISPDDIQTVELSPKKKISGYLRSCSGFTFQAGIYIKNENNWRGNLSAVRFFISKEGSPAAPFRVRIYEVDEKAIQ